MKSLSVRRLISLLSASALVATLAVASVPAVASAAATSCTYTGFVRDSINMTAAQIGGNVTAALDAGGCNIGVYYGPLYDSGTTYPVTQGNVTGQAPSGNVTGAAIYGANYFGVLVNGDVGTVSVNVTNSAIHDIGEVPLNGTQHGVAVYYRAFGGAASGIISGNTITNYQKGGITANGAVSATISNNTVTGQGRVDYIAQNGIQVAYGAMATVTGNTVTGNAYTGTNNASSAGILVVGGACYGTANTVNLSITKNTVTSNDVGVWIFNAGADCVTAPTTKTNNTVKFNMISNTVVTNVSGDNGVTLGGITYAACGYQAGVSDTGNKDLIVNNTISGSGYTPQAGGDCKGTPPAFLRFIDLTGSARGVPSNK